MAINAGKMMVSVLALACLALQGRCGQLRGQSDTGGSVSVGEVESSLISELVGLVAKDRPAEFEKDLQQTFATLPKNEKGNLGHQAVRYVLHRFFVHRHGWFIKGLEPNGKADDTANFMKDSKDEEVVFQPGPIGLGAHWTSGEVALVAEGGQGERLGVQVGWTFKTVNGIAYTEDLVEQAIEGKEPYTVVFGKEWVPAYIQDMLEKRVQEHGINLQELAALAATLESLIQKESHRNLEEAYALLRLPKDGDLNKTQVDTVIDMYMMDYLSDDKISADSAAEAQMQLDAFIRDYEDWFALESWLKKIKLPHLRGLGKEKQGLDFAAVSRIVTDISEHFGSFNDLECKSLKSTLLKMEGRMDGRVPLSEFYKKSLYSHWKFTEKVDYLRVLGALDESNSSRPQVIVPNYLSSRPNCLESTSLYAVCCRNECEDLLGHLEKKLTVSHASPDQILELVATMSSDTVKAPRQISNALMRRLQEVSAVNGGRVPLHGRLFAQWMHHAFPRECPFPHESGTVNPQTPDEWMKETGHENHRASEAEMQAHVDACKESDHHSDGQDELPWSSQEVLLSQDHFFKDKASARSSINRPNFCLAVGLFMLAAILIGIASLKAKRSGLLQAIEQGDELVCICMAASVLAFIFAAVAAEFVDPMLLGWGLLAGCAFVVLRHVSQRQRPKTVYKCIE